MCTLQELLDVHMGMSVDTMRKFADSEPADRDSDSLLGAHLPKRGFYRIKSVAAGQLQKQRAPGSCSFRGLSCLGCAGSKADSSGTTPQDGEGSDSVGEDAVQSGDGQAGSADVAPVRMPLEV